MATNENNHVLTIIHKGLYIVAGLECILLFAPIGNSVFLSSIMSALYRVDILTFPSVKWFELLLILLVVIGTKPKKKIEVDITKEIVLPTFFGAVLFSVSFLIINKAILTENHLFGYFNEWSIIYILTTFIGIVLLVNGLSSIFKIIKNNFGKDRFNLEEESFEQERRKLETEYSINIPTRFYFQKKWHNGWLNIDPFRGSLVIGTPGSGKSFGVINPAIRQTVHKGFSMLLYDFKYPDLTDIAYRNYLDKKKNDKNYNHSFYVINPNDVEKSIRVNPLRKEYVKSLPLAQDVAETLVLALQKGGEQGGSGQFFTQSAINFLSCCIYFLSKRENGKYCSLPHLMSFLNLGYEEIFEAIFKIPELESLLSTFKSAYDNKAFDQLEGQLGTLKIYITRLATKENYWVFTEEEGEEFNFKLSDTTDPSILVLANSPETQNINSAVFSSVINRVIQQINSKGNLPSAVIADEFPTIYFHSIENTIATARSNKVAVILGLQELTQLRQYYKKQVADTLASVVGNVFSGSVRERQTLQWIESLIGKAKQITHSYSISQNGTNITTNEKMDFLVPQSKIATLRTGQMVGVLADSNIINESTYASETKSVFNAKINLDIKEIKREERKIKKVGHFYNMVDEDTIESINQKKIEIEKVLANKKIGQEERKEIVKKLNIQLRDLEDNKYNQIDRILTIHFEKIKKDVESIL